MKLKSLKRRKPIVYISLVMYALLSTIIIAESCMPDGLSGAQSDVFATISAWFINLVNGPQIPKSIAPKSFGEVTDTSYLGQDDEGISNIAIGTTTLVSIPINYPKLNKSIDVYNYEFEFNYVLGDKNDYNLVIGSRKLDDVTYCIDMRVVANDMGDDLYQIDINVADTLTYNYKFHIVELATPTNYQCKIEKTQLKIGETSLITTELLDKEKSDTYLRRYLDETKIHRESSNENVATIDKYGVIHGVNQGNAKITFGKYEYNITVSNENIVKPVVNELNLSIDANSKSSLALLDYDYVFEKGEESNAYSALIYGSFTDDTLEDQSLSWEVDDPLKAKLAPYKYDSNGYPIYHDDSNKPCVRVCGYRKKGEVTIKCYSNSDNTINKTITIDVGELFPENMNLSLKDTVEVFVNEQRTITAYFNPKNVNDKNIHVEVDNPSIVKIVNNDTSSVIISGTKVGKTHVTVTSLANTDVKKEFDLVFKAKDVINVDNYDDFSGFMRKAAGHFTLFLVNAVFGMIFFYTYFDDIKRIWTSIIVSSSIGLVIAGLSEFIQLFVPGRSGTFVDVGIDFLGYVIGTAITIGVIYLIRYIKSKRDKKKETIDQQ